MEIFQEDLTTTSTTINDNQGACQLSKSIDLRETHLGTLRFPSFAALYIF